MLRGDMNLSVSDAIRQVCGEKGATSVNSELYYDHAHMFVEIQPRVLVRDFVRWTTGGTQEPVGT